MPTAENLDKVLKEHTTFILILIVVGGFFFVGGLGGGGGRWDGTGEGVLSM